MTAKIYVPERGDVMWIEFNPQAGHEQAGRRPALVLSPSAYNGKVGLAIFCPITNQVKGYPFEVAIPKGFKVGGVIYLIKQKVWTGKSERLHLFVNCHHQPLMMY